MRVQLHKDRQALESLLANIESRTFSSSSIAELEEACAAHTSLSRFSYLKDYEPRLLLETKLRDRYLAAFDSVEQRMRGGVTLLRTELEQPKPDTRRISRIYSLVKHLGADQALDSVSSPLIRESAGESLRRLRGYKEEAQQLLRSDYLVGDQRLIEACDRLSTITANIKHETADNASTFAAADLCRYIRREASVLRQRLLEHSKYAATHYSETLQHKGVSKLEAEELSRLYSADCIAVEARLVHIIEAANVKPPSTEQHQLILGVRCAKACDKLADMLKHYGSVERFNLIPYLSLTTDEATAQELLRSPEKLTRHKFVIYKPSEYSVKPLPAEFHEDTWNLDLVHAPEAWNYSKGEDVKVAIVDTGVDYNHVDLAARFSKQRGVNFVGGDEPLDDNGHGTHVAGTIAGSRTGMAPAATLYAVKVLDMNGIGSEISVLQGIEWAIEHADVINMSLGSSFPSEPEAELIAIANQRGIAVAAAAGNDGTGDYNYPASHPGAISVAAVDRDKKHASFSNYNDRVALCAPGVSIYSTWLGGGYNVLSGTSMATPHVAGGCALVKQGDFCEVLRRSAEKLGDEEYYGAGLIDLAKAVQS